MDVKGYYGILGVPPNATPKEIKYAYRALAIRYHPDKNKSQYASEMMKKINEAYGVLSDKEERIKYDRLKIENIVNQTSSTGDWQEGYNKNNQKQDEDDENKWLFDVLMKAFRYASVKSTEIEKKKVSIKWQMLFSLIPVVNLWAFYRIGRTFMSLAVMIPIFAGSITIMILVGPANPYIGYISMSLNGIALLFLMFKWSSEWNRHYAQYGYGSPIDYVDIRWQLFCSVIPFVNISAFARIEAFCKSVAVAIPTYIMIGFLHTLFSNWLNHSQDNASFLLSIGLTSPIFVFFMRKWGKEWNRQNQF